MWHQKLTIKIIIHKPFLGKPLFFVSETLSPDSMKKKRASNNAFPREKFLQACDGFYFSFGAGYGLVGRVSTMGFKLT